jgi:hypothetical protein
VKHTAYAGISPISSSAKKSTEEVNREAKQYGKKWPVLIPICVRLCFMASEEPGSLLGVEFRRWLAERLLLGVSLDTVRATLAQTGLPVSLIDSELNAIVCDPLVEVALASVRRRMKVENLLRVYSALWRQSGIPSVVERFPSLTRDTFYRDYYFRNRPVVLTEAVSGWPAMDRWNLDYFAKLSAPELQITDGRESDPDYELNLEHHVRHTSFGEFIARLRSTPESNDFYLVARNDAFRNTDLAALLDDIRVPEPYLEANATWRDSVALWMGPSGTVTPLHHDRSNFFFVQVLGSKQFTLFPAFELPNMYNERGVYSSVDPVSPDPVRFPAFGMALRYDLVLNPGESLFLPVGWWHWVKALDISVSVSFQNFCVEGENTPWPGDYWI